MAFAANKYKGFFLLFCPGYRILFHSEYNVPFGEIGTTHQYPPQKKHLYAGSISPGKHAGIYQPTYSIFLPSYCFECPVKWVEKPSTYDRLSLDRKKMALR